MKIIVSYPLLGLFLFMLTFVSCTKVNESNGNQPTEPEYLSAEQLPDRIPEDVFPSKSDLYNLTKKFETSLSEKSAQSFTPSQLKFALETYYNREYKAGSVKGDSLRSHALLFNYEIDQDGYVTQSSSADLNSFLLSHLNTLIDLGEDFYAIDIEITVGQKMMVDVITTIGYVNTDLAFGFNTFPSGIMVLPFSNDFENQVNDRLIFEAIDPEEFFITDIYPNPAWDPDGITCGLVEIIGTLGIGDCLMYNGTKEIWGGPENVIGGFYDHEQWSSDLVNDRLLRGINYVANFQPLAEGFQLVNLEFNLYLNLNADPLVNNCLPGDECNTYYPCFGRYHDWRQGRFARKMVLSK